LSVVSWSIQNAEWFDRAYGVGKRDLTEGTVW
jgi:hypothetical protein